MQIDLKNKKALVTGGRGLAAGIIEGLAAAGASVAVISKSGACPLCARGFKADIGDRSQRKTAFNTAVEYLGGIDILVNCAGIQRRHELEEFPLEDWDEVIEVNLTAAWELAQLAAREMIRAGHGGKIINIASMLSFFGGLRIPAYAAAKGGIAQITKSMAIGWARYGIQVNALAPGYMDTDMNTALKNDEARFNTILSRIPAGRWGTPKDMAGPCVFLASSLSDYITGAVIPVDGGYLVM